VGGSASYFDAVSITSGIPRTLLIEFAGASNFMDVPITVRATDPSGLTKDVTLSFARAESLPCGVKNARQCHAASQPTRRRRSRRPE